MSMAKQIKISRLSSKQSWFSKDVKYSFRTLPLINWWQRNRVSPHSKTACNQNHWMCSWLPQIRHGASGCALGFWTCGRGELPSEKKDVWQLLSALCIQNHNHPVVCGNKKRCNAGIWPVEKFYVPFKKEPVFCQNGGICVAFFSEAAFLKLPIWPKKVVSGFLLWWFEMGRIHAARSWLLIKTEGWDIWELCVDNEPFPGLQKQNRRVQADMGIEKK